MDKFCRNCGAKLDSGRFCPSCGSLREGCDEPGTSGPTYEESVPYTAPQSVNYSYDKGKAPVGLSVILILTGVFLAAVGVIMMMGVDSVYDTLINNSEIQEFLKQHSMTVEEFKNFVYNTSGLVAAAFAVPGILGIIAGILGLNRKGYTFGLIVCIIYMIFSTLTFLAMLISGGLLGLLFVLMPLFGIIFIMKWTKAKGSFC